MDEALHRLARAAGIESGYWDGLGTRRDLSDDTAQALLSALGFDPDHALDAQATALEQRAFSHTLPPVLLVAPGATATFELSLPLQRATKHKTCFGLQYNIKGCSIAIFTKARKVCVN